MWMLTFLLIGCERLVSGGSPPRIIQHPSDLVVPKNEPATLQCQADGQPPPQISWYKDQGELISTSVASVDSSLLNLFGGKPKSEHQQQHGSEQPRLIQQNGALHFLRVVHNKKDKPDAGVYWCVATNPFGEVRSRNATLQVAFLRDEFRRQPNASVRVSSEASALLECHAPRGYPVPKIYWKRDGKDLKTTGRFALMDEGNLVISDVRPSDAGQYVCVAENIAAVKESHPVSLYVYARPSVITPPQDITALADDNIVFECKVVGDPLPLVTWYKKDSRRSLADSRFKIQDDGGLRINRVGAVDEGTYVCQADNSMGSVSESATLTVHSRPTIVMAPRDQRVVVGGAATFDCLTSGNPSPAVFWTKEGSQILMFPGQPHGRFSVQSDGTLIITGVEKEDFGNYVCSALSVAGSAVEKGSSRVLASSESGRTTWSAGLVVESPTNPHVIFHRMPDFGCPAGSPAKPVLTNVTETAIEISWTPSTISEDSSTIRLYRVEYFCFEDPRGWVMGSHPTTLTHFTASDLKPDSSYVFLVRAMTQHGVISPPSPLSDKVMTLSVGRTAALHDLNELRSKFSQPMVELTAVTAISPTAVSLRWLIIQHEQYIAGYYVKYREPGVPTSNYSVINFRKGSSLSHNIFGLKKYTEYEFRLVPAYKDIMGRESNALRMRTLSDVPDEAPQDVKVTLIDQNTLSVSWQPPAPHHVNGQLAGYRVSIIPTGNGAVPATGNTTQTLTQIRNVTAGVGHADPGKEVVGNLTTGMRYRITVAAKTDAGLGVPSRPLYIKMERTAAGITDLFQQPWFIGLLCSTLVLLLAAVLIILLLNWRKRQLILKKTELYHSRTCPAGEKVYHFHPHLRSSESGSLLPNSIVGLPFVPATSGLMLAHHHPANGATNWLTTSANSNPADWTKQACDANNSRFHNCGNHDQPGGGGGEGLHTCCPVHGRTMYGSMARRGSGPKAYGEVTERLAKLETGESSLSSHGRSYQETVSVHSRRSSADSTHPPVPNWKDLLPPPPLGPPSPQSSEDQSTVSKPYRETELDRFSTLENDLAQRMAELRRRYQMELEELDNASLRRPPPRYSGAMPATADGGRNRRMLYLQHASLDRPLRGAPRMDPAQLFAGQYFAHRMEHSLSRTRSCESSINNDGERESDGSSDNDTTDVHYIDDANGETSPCLSSEASFFLEKGIPVSVTNASVNRVNGTTTTGRLNGATRTALPSSRSRELRHQSGNLHRIVQADKFRKPLPVHRNSPRRYFMARQASDSPDAPHNPSLAYFNGSQRISTLPLKNSNGKMHNFPPVLRQMQTRLKGRTSGKAFGNASDPPQSVC
ncbi:Roundabout-like protein 2 [Hypsibius exemplaris]|uniref:Roundabout-like protein 2 n=1 Tax=Hypsibius exemplaris TaxID=2072580 RepID=A0A1W0X216_HYPEX|nr:Roundabout-like protein 2 [Hypsibius exemplaris]